MATTYGSGARTGAASFRSTTYRDENHRTLNVLARRTGFVKGASVLSGYHVAAPNDGNAVGSASADELMNDVADWISRQDY